MHSLPPAVAQLLADASKCIRTASKQKIFESKVFGSDWDKFVEQWAPKIYVFLQGALGEFGKEPLPVILPMEDGYHMSGATAAFTPLSGQIHLCRSTEGRPGQILEKLTHEMTHASLAMFPEGDPFYEESVVDYSVWVMAHAPVWGNYGKAMIEAAAFNIEMRRERALRLHTDYDCKRWAGGLFASLAYGPFILTRLRAKKMVSDLTW